MAGTTDYGNPVDWDEIPDDFSAALQAALATYGWTILDAHEAAITVNAPNVPDGHTWYLTPPNFHGWWAYGVANERGVAPHVDWLYADPGDPQAVADAAHAVLTARRA